MSPRPGHPRSAVFLDRDDTLNANATLPDNAFPATRGDLFQPDHVRLLPGVFDACTRLADAGFALVIVTNQAAVARGSAAIRDIEATNDRLRELLTIEGRCLIDAAYAAPHHPDSEIDHLAHAHPWRKPGPGMPHTAARELNLDIPRSWLIGDAERDVEAGRAAGVPPEHCLRVGREGDFPGLPDAVDHILSAPGGTGVTPVSPPSSLTFTPASVVTLRAFDSRPLADADTRRTVESAARAIAERIGVRLIDLTLDDRSVSATLAIHRLGALGFMAELRRATNVWYTHKHPGQKLWPATPKHHD
ncbi:MAG: HAD-IIIA family hydrolase [Phycisphaeraceae bacterium]|nr:MAG: HAD-IIIA family hydrolase [Phycisphaeraceae bacterium]